MSAPTTAALARLEELLGAASVLAEPSQLAAYAVDGVEPAAVVRPGSAEEVAAVVRFAAAEKLALIAAGSRTKLRIGMPPARYDVAVDLTRLDRVVSYDPGDLTLSVEPGISLEKLAGVLAEHNQFLPLAVPYTSQAAAGAATVGGTIVTGVDTPLRQFYGTARDYVLGMEFVTGEGAQVKSGGRVVKNVAGYDLHKLMIGALGTLGILTRVNFRTFPLPPASRGFLASFPNGEGALELRRRIATSPLQPLTLEMLSPTLATIFAQRAPQTNGAPLAPPGPWFSTSEWTLAAGFGGTERVLERYAKELSRLAEETRATNSVVLGDAERPLVWGRLRECIPMLLEVSPVATIAKISILPAQLGALLEALHRISESHALPGATLARGVGVVYFALLPEKLDPETLRRLASACRDAFQRAAALGGHAIVPWCPTELKREVNVWGPVRDDLVLMQKLKKTFDPQNILSPGRFLGRV